MFMLGCLVLIVLVVLILFMLGMDMFIRIMLGVSEWVWVSVFLLLLVLLIMCRLVLFLRSLWVFLWIIGWLFISSRVMGWVVLFLVCSMGVV